MSLPGIEKALPWATAGGGQMCGRGFPGIVPFRLPPAANESETASGPDDFPGRLGGGAVDKLTGGRAVEWTS